MINFRNTELAFQHQTTGALKMSAFLFNLLQHRYLLRVLGGLSYLALKIHFPIAWAVKPTLYKHFVGGESLEKCLPMTDKMKQLGVSSILDYAAEGAVTQKQILETSKELMRSVRFSGINQSVSFSVFKPTALIYQDILRKVSDKTPLTDQENTHYQQFLTIVHNLCKAAVEADKPILIDAEDYWFQPAIDQLVEDCMAMYNQQKAIVFTTLQMYRTDRLAYLEKLFADAVEKNYYLGVKLVRGAYLEKERQRAKDGHYPSPIYPDKQSTDDAFDQAVSRCLDHIDQVSLFCGTHNQLSLERLVQRLQKTENQNYLHKVCVSQLYGMSDNLSFNIAAQGYQVSKYVPYGTIREVLPYLLRRAEENSAMAGQSNRDLELIRTEIRRRRKK